MTPFPEAFQFSSHREITGDSGPWFVCGSFLLRAVPWGSGDAVGMLEAVGP